MHKNKNRCSKCKHFMQYFFCGYLNFYVTDSGYCDKSRKITDKESCCNNFKKAVSEKKPTADEVGVAYDNLKRIEELLMNLHII